MQGRLHAGPRQKPPWSQFHKRGWLDSSWHHTRTQTCLWGKRKQILCFVVPGSCPGGRTGKWNRDPQDPAGFLRAQSPAPSPLPAKLPRAAPRHTPKPGQTRLCQLPRAGLETQAPEPPQAATSRRWPRGRDRLAANGSRGPTAADTVP